MQYSPKAHLLVERYAWLKRKGKTPERYATPESIHVRQPCRSEVTTRSGIDLQYCASNAGEFEVEIYTGREPHQQPQQGGSDNDNSRSECT